ncbi:MAG: hypothetical protein AAGB11_06590 [Pseudomonadota bacterium]
MLESGKDMFGEGSAPFRTRSEVLFSADGRSAVVLRRGPRLHHRLINWNLRSDTFGLGQWMKGTVQLWDLNKDGSKLIYWARQWHMSAPRHGDEWAGEAFSIADEAPIAPRTRKRGKRKIPRYMREESIGTLRRGPLKPRRNEGVWTALSTPPYFSALAIWPSFGHWTGGGWFEDNATLALQENDRGLVPKVNARLPDDLAIKSAIGDSHPFSATRMPGLSYRPVYLDGRSAAFEDLAAKMMEEGVRWVDWFYPSKRDLLFGADGQLFRLAEWRKVPAQDAIHAATCLLDMRPMRFELMVAPVAALRWNRRRVGC